MNSLKHLFKLPILPKKDKSLIINTYTLGNFSKFILPNTYLSYLSRLGRLVSSGNSLVRLQGIDFQYFGKLGKVFCKKEFKYFFVTALLSSCSPIYTLTKEDREILKKYPNIILLQSGKSHLIKARNIEITDSIRKAQELDLAQEYIEEQYNNDYQE